MGKISFFHQPTTSVAVPRECPEDCFAVGEKWIFSEEEEGSLARREERFVSDSEIFGGNLVEE